MYSNWAQYLADPLNVGPEPIDESESSQGQQARPATCRVRSSLVESDYQVSDEELIEEDDPVD